MDWTVFWATVFGTFAGALVGIFGVWLVFRLESRDRYRTRLDDAVARVMVNLAEYNDAMLTYMRELSLVEDGEAPPILPSDLPAVASMEVAVMVSRGEDFEILNNLAHNTYTAVRMGEPRAIAGAHGIIIGELGRWRSGRRSKKDVLASFDSAAQIATRLLRNPPENS